MKHKSQNRSGYCGHLPEKAPLANPYVPFQLEDPPKYEPRFGLIRGTIYPGLDLPFHGKANQKELAVTPMTELQAIHFAIQELAMYLDTHREDRQALEAYRAYQKLYEKCREAHRHHQGPMSHLNVDDCEEYRWLDDPWPWEYCKNKGV